MALRATPTIAICLTAGIAAGIALARPGDEAPAVSAPLAEATAQAPVETSAPPNDSPYLADGEEPIDAAPAVDDENPAQPAEPVAISIEGFTFSPTDPVAAGSPITVTNLDGTDHTLTARNGEFGTGTLGQDELASFDAPSAPGTYEFFCEIHPSMTGELVVS